MESLLVAVGHVYDLITYIYTVIAVHLADFVNCDDVAAVYAQEEGRRDRPSLLKIAIKNIDILSFCILFAIFAHRTPNYIQYDLEQERQFRLYAK